MDLNLSVFQEPRGVMRIFHLVFSICAFATTVNYAGIISSDCAKDVFTFSYPFNINMNLPLTALNNTTSCGNGTATGDFSSDSTFFVCTGVLAMLYSLGILIVYTKFDSLYKNNDKVPLFDFVLSVVLAIFWLSSSAAWANGLSGLKTVTDPHIINIDGKCDDCHIYTTNFGSLNISVVLGFLNFFLWAANLWFLYKETKWFQKPVATGA